MTDTDNTAPPTQTPAEIAIDAYQRLGSYKLAAAEVGLSAATVSKYVKAAGLAPVRGVAADGQARPSTLESAAQAMTPTQSMSCPLCGFKFTSPQAKCRVSSACAARAAKRNQPTVAA